MDQSVPTQPVRMLGHYLRPSRGRVTLLTILLMTSIGLQLLAPQLLGRFVDAATGQGGQGDGSANRLYAIAGLFFAAVLAQKALFLISVYLTEDLGWATTNALRADLTGCLLYTSDAADERSSVDLGGRRIIKKKTSKLREQSYEH